MKIFGKMGRFSKRVVDYDGHKNSVSMIGRILGQTRDQLKGKAPAEGETMESFSAEEKATIKSQLRKTSIIFWAITVLAVINMIYFITKGDFFAVILSVAFLVLCAAHIFKYEFLLYRFNNPEKPANPQGFFDHLLKRDRK